MTIRTLFKINPLRFIVSLMLEGISAMLVVLETYFLTIQFDKIKIHDYHGFFLFAFLQIISFILSSGFKQLGNYLWTVQVQNGFHQIRKNFLDSLVKNKQRYHPDDVQNQLVKNLKIVKEGYTDSIKDAVYQSVLLLFITTTLLQLQWEIFIIALIWSSIQLYLPKLFEKKLDIAYSNLSEQNKKYLNILNNWLIGLNEIRRYTATAYLFKILGHAGKNVEKSVISKSKVDQQIEYLNSLIYNLGDSILFIITAIIIIFYDGNFGLIASITSFNFYLFGSLMNISTYHVKIKGTKQIRNELIVDKVEVSTHADTGGSPSGFKIENLKIKFSNGQNISYPNFVVKSGEKILLTGKSGRGKSTLFKLLLGDMLPNNGKITYFDNENKEVLPNYSQIGYLSQSPILVPGTILENITMFKSSLIPRVSKIEQKVQLVGEFSKGLDTNLDLVNENYSGGQKQKIVLARSLVHDSNLLLIDEGTSAIDQKSTLEIIKNLVRTKRTIVFIAHSLTPEMRELFDREINLDKEE
ncbi:ABC transporter ATP-binding protein [uncultured Lactobacillus sp.]|uniref:ABC transporter ATP-binding protein n=1 Tax=uncultured Lactobacillus sp. TaxID=153152 RepID=UPI002611525D|nr:ABC transporter ATP-binding protein [uncultured Lactobacillus sp.]